VFLPPSPVYLSLSPSLVVDSYITAHGVYKTGIAEAPPVPVGRVGTSASGEGGGVGNRGVYYGWIFLD
jgi:hypothetical protein